MLDTRNPDIRKAQRSLRKFLTLLSGLMLGYFEMQYVFMGSNVLGSYSES